MRRRKLRAKLELHVYLVVQQRVQSLPVVFYLGGDVFVLQHHSSHSALAPLWEQRRTQ